MASDENLDASFGSRSSVGRGFRAGRDSSRGGYLELDSCVVASSCQQACENLDSNETIGIPEGHASQSPQETMPIPEGHATWTPLFTPENRRPSREKAVTMMKKRAGSKESLRGRRALRSADLLLAAASLAHDGDRLSYSDVLARLEAQEHLDENATWVMGDETEDFQHRLEQLSEWIDELSDGDPLDFIRGRMSPSGRMRMRRKSEELLSGTDSKRQSEQGGLTYSRRNSVCGLVGENESDELGGASIVRRRVVELRISRRHTTEAVINRDPKSPTKEEFSLSSTFPLPGREQFGSLTPFSEDLDNWIRQDLPKDLDSFESVSRNRQATSASDPPDRDASKTEAASTVRRVHSIENLKNLIQGCPDSPRIWETKQETIFIFDWDDTIFPTTFVNADSRLHFKKLCPAFEDQSMPLHPDRHARQTTASSMGGDEGLSNLSDGRDLAPHTAASGSGYFAPVTNGRAGYSLSPRSSEGLSSAEESAAEELPKTLYDALHRHAQTALAVLEKASRLGKVVVVTLAAVGWVEESVRNFFPDCSDIWDELGIEVVYARSALRPRQMRSASADDIDLRVVLKYNAMRSAVRHFYRRPNCKKGIWRNVIGIGDQTWDRDALKESAFLHSQLDKHGCEIPLRVKTVKFSEDPSLLELTKELEVLKGLLNSVVSFDGDLTLDLDKTDVGSFHLADCFRLTPFDRQASEGSSAAVCDVFSSSSSKENSAVSTVFSSPVTPASPSKAKW